MGNVVSTGELTPLPSYEWVWKKGEAADRLQVAHSPALARIDLPHQQLPLLVCAWEASPALYGDDHQHIRISTSVDGGVKWSPPRPVVWGLLPVWTPVLHYDEGAGTLHLFYAESRKARSPGGDVKCVCSVDCGETWSAPKTLLTHEHGSGGPKVIGGPLVAAADGRWLLPYHREAPGAFQGSAGWHPLKEALEWPQAARGAALAWQHAAPRGAPEDSGTCVSGLLVSADRGATWSTAGGSVEPADAFLGATTSGFIAAAAAGVTANGGSAGGTPPQGASPTAAAAAAVGGGAGDGGASDAGASGAPALPPSPSPSWLVCPAVAELSPGRLLMLLRSSAGTAFQAYSMDGGATFTPAFAARGLPNPDSRVCVRVCTLPHTASEAAAAPSHALPTPGGAAAAAADSGGSSTGEAPAPPATAAAAAAVAAAGGGTVGSSGGGQELLLAAYNHAAPGAGRRSPLALAISRDGGCHWRPVVGIDGGDAGHFCNPCIVPWVGREIKVAYSVWGAARGDAGVKVATVSFPEGWVAPEATPGGGSAPGPSPYASRQSSRPTTPQQTAAAPPSSTAAAAAAATASRPGIGDQAGGVPVAGAPPADAQ